MGVVAEIEIFLGFFLKAQLKLENSLPSLIYLFSPSQVNCSVPREACLFLEGL